MTHQAIPTPPHDEARRDRAKKRLYVHCQAIGWGLFLAVQVFFSLSISGRDTQRDPITLVATLVMVSAFGLLLTHYAHAVVARLGWRDLGWRALFPRVFVLAVVLSALWSAAGYGYMHGLLRQPWESKHSWVLIVSISWLNFATVLHRWNRPCPM